METFKINISLVARYFVCLIMVFLVHISFITIFTMASTKNAGYDAYALNTETNEYEKVYTHYYSDGEDTKMKQYEADGVPVKTAVFRSDFEGTPYIVCMVFSQVFSLLIFIILVPTKLHKYGDSDANKVSFGRTTEDLSRGFKYGIGALAVNVASFAILVLCKLGVIGSIGLSIFKLLNYHLFGYIQLIFGKASTCESIGWGTIALALLPTVLTAVSCTLLYIFGYKRINFYDKLMLQNKK